MYTVSTIKLALHCLTSPYRVVIQCLVSQNGLLHANIYIKSAVDAAAAAYLTRPEQEYTKPPPVPANIVTPTVPARGLAVSGWILLLRMHRRRYGCAYDDGREPRVYMRWGVRWTLPVRRRRGGGHRKIAFQRRRGLDPGDLGRRTVVAQRRARCSQLLSLIW